MNNAKEYEATKKENRMLREWIAVDDWLPELNVHCLVYFSGDERPHCLYRQQFSDRVEWVDDSERTSSLVDYIEPTHWMPLPEPPKEVNDE